MVNRTQESKQRTARLLVESGCSVGAEHVRIISEQEGHREVGEACNKKKRTHTIAYVPTCHEDGAGSTEHD